VTLAVEGGPALTVRQDDGSWRLYDGSPDNATVALRLDRPEAALLISRGMTKAAVVERLKLEGDEELCQLFSIGLSAFFGR
jgi:hypothetical protein